MKTISAKVSEKWLSELSKNILILSENGISISEIVNRLHKNYKSKQTCWAAISRACKKLARKNLLTLYKRNSRVQEVLTTINGKKLIHEHCSDLEILSLQGNITKFQQRSREITELTENENYNMNPEIKKLILQILAKYGELTLEGISYCLELPQSEVINLLDQMIRSSLILRIENLDIKFQINWKYLFLPVGNAEKGE